MRKLITIILTAFAAAGVFPAFASARVPQPGDPGVRVAKFWIGKAYYEVNGQRFEMDVAPYIKNGRTLLPVRYVGYALGVAPEDIIWDPAKRQAILKRWWGKEEDLAYYDVVFFIADDKRFCVDEQPIWGFLDQAAEIKNGRMMLPMRAAVHALGGLCFWDPKERSVTVETWEKLPPPVSTTVEEVAAPRDKCVATVVYSSGTKIEAKTNRPVVTSKQGFKIDAIEWFKLWGFPENAMLFDPVKGGLFIRGGLSDVNYKTSRSHITGIAFYAGEKSYWNAWYYQHPPNDNKKSDPMFIEGDVLWGDNAVADAPADLLGYPFPPQGYDMNGVIGTRMW